MNNLSVECLSHIAQYLNPTDYLNLIRTSRHINSILNTPLVRLDILNNQFGGNLYTLLLFLYEKGLKAEVKIILNSQKYSPKWRINDNDILFTIFSYLIDGQMYGELIEFWKTFPKFEVPIASQSNILLKAEASDDICFLKYLIQKGIDVNIRPNDLLFAVITDNKLDRLKLLLESNIKIDEPSKVLEWASRNQNDEIFRYLIEETSDIFKICNNQEYETYLFNACLSANEELVIYLLTKWSSFIQSNDTLDMALIMLFQRINKKQISYQILTKLLNLGANIDISHSLPLVCGIITNNAPLVKYLIKRGASVHAETSDEDLLALACRLSNQTIIRMLLKAGANPYSFNGLPILNLVKTKKNKLLREILEKNEKVKQKNKLKQINLARGVDWKSLLIEANKVLNFEGATIIWKASQKISSGISLDTLIEI